MNPRGLRIRGHPVHPMVAGFPVAFWAGTVWWDVMALVRPHELWLPLAFWTLVLGLVTSLPAAASGLWELWSLPENHPAERIAWRHMGAMSTALCCFLASLVLRWESLGQARPPWPAIALAVVGLVSTFAGDWLGGELVFRHGVAVEKQDTP